MISEPQLDRAFAENILDSEVFVLWVLSQTTFSKYADDAVLLNEEQARIKPNKKPENWWKHWWCELEDGSQSETDIFLVFSHAGLENRFAIHIENKPPHGSFREQQPENYHHRALFMSKKEKYMNYDMFCTVLLAPESFMKLNSDKTKYFDSLLSYEAVGQYIPLFEQSLNEK